MSEGTKQKGPVYTGITKHVRKEDGYAVWLPTDWRRIEMVEGHNGWIFTPYQDRFDTCFMCEKFTLDYSVTPEDLDTLAEGFETGINSLEEVEFEEKNYEAGKKIVVLNAKFTFTEDGQRRKRWVKSMYWAEANLVMIAQGASVDEYAYWEGMLFNAMHNYELGIV